MPPGILESCEYARACVHEESSRASQRCLSAPLKTRRSVPLVTQSSRPGTSARAEPHSILRGCFPSNYGRHSERESCKMFRKTASLSLFLRDDDEKKLLSAAMKNEGARATLTLKSSHFRTPRGISLLPLFCRSASLGQVRPSSSVADAEAFRPHLSPLASNIGGGSGGRVERG